MCNRQIKSKRGIVPLFLLDINNWPLIIGAIVLWALIQFYYSISLIVWSILLTITISSFAILRIKQNTAQLASRSKKVEEQIEALNDLILILQSRLDEVQRDLGLELQSLSPESIRSVATLRRLLIALEEHLDELISLLSSGEVYNLTRAENLLKCHLELPWTAVYKTVDSMQLPPLKPSMLKPVAFSLLNDIEQEVSAAMRTIEDARKKCKKNSGRRLNLRSGKL